jgi:hypothetical protein
MARATSSAPPTAKAAARPWYGLDDSAFVKGVETVFLNARGQRLVAKAWTPPPLEPSSGAARGAAAAVAAAVASGVSAPAAAAVHGAGAGVGSAAALPSPVTRDKGIWAPFPRAVIIFCHDFVRGVGYRVVSCRLWASLSRFYATDPPPSLHVPTPPPSVSPCHRRRAVRL